MNSRKKGISLTFVLIIFLIIISVGTALLSLTLTVYKNQTVKNKKAKNLYSAESGLDTAYNILSKTIEIAIETSNKAVEETIKQEDRKFEKNKLIEEQDLIFRKNFIEIIKRNLKVCIDEKKGYIEKISGFEKSELEIDNSLKYILYYNYLGNYKLVDDINLKNSEITTEFINENIEDEDNIIPIKITSEFYSYNNDSKKEKRIVSVQYDIVIPKYNAVKTTKKIQIINTPVLEKSIAVDGNTYLTGNININGDIYSKGTENNSINDTNESIEDLKKYNEGIIIESGSKVNISGEIVTNRTVNLKGNTDLNVDGNLYAANMYLGSNNIKLKTMEVNDKESSNKKLNLYLNNDLDIRGKNTILNIDSFYGLNDINGMIENQEEFSKYVKSSSIIINVMKSKLDSSIEKLVELTIKNEAYILGTAYINTENKYQTGESVAIKGNYIAYTESLEGQTINDQKYDKVQFVYDKPLQLVSSFNGINELNVFDKAKYFEDYYTKNKEKLNNSVVVNLPAETYSVGAYINNGEVKGTTSNILDKISGDIKNKQEEFSNKVYGFGIETPNFYRPEKINCVSTILNLENLKPLEDDETMGEYLYDVIFNGDKNKNIIIIGEGISNSTIERLKNDSNNIVYTLNSRSEKNKFKGLVLTSGNVTIYGNVYFEGSIVAGGDLICDNGNKTFNYNDTVVKEVVAYYYDKLYNEKEEESVIKSIGDKKTENIEIVYTGLKQHNVKDYIKREVWNIEK